MKILLLIMISLNVYSSNNYSYINGDEGGVIDGGGSDHLELSKGSAWFLKGNGNGSIKTCIQNTQESGVETEKLKELIIWSFKSWEEYIEKNLYIESESEEDELDKFAKFQMKLEFINTCKDFDLKIQIGQKNEYIENILAKMNNPIAFASREKYNIEKGWSKGLIWLNNNFKSEGSEVAINYWKVEENLKGILLHEVGHVLGLGHFSETIMQSSIADSMSNPDSNQTNKMLEEIDWKKKLYLDTLHFFESKTGGIWINGSVGEKKIFKKLTGRLPVGKVTSEYKFEKPYYRKLDAREEFKGIFKLRDDKKDYNFDIVFKLNYIAAKVIYEKKFFRLVNRVNESGTTETRAYGILSFPILSSYGHLDLNGKKMSLIFNNQMNDFFLFSPFPEDDGKIIFNKGATELYMIEEGNILPLNVNIEVLEKSDPVAIKRLGKKKNR